MLFVIMKFLGDLWRIWLKTAPNDPAPDQIPVIVIYGQYNTSTDLLLDNMIKQKADTAQYHVCSSSVLVNVKLNNFMREIMYSRFYHIFLDIFL